MLPPSQLIARVPLEICASWTPQVSPLVCNLSPNIQNPPRPRNKSASHDSFPFPNKCPSSTPPQLLQSIQTWTVSPFHTSSIGYQHSLHSAFSSLFVSKFGHNPLRQVSYLYQCPLLYCCCYSSLLQGIASVVTEASSVPSSGLPSRIDVAYRDAGGIPPTHILAAINPKQGKGFLFPIHELVIVSQCANLPPLPPSDAKPTTRANHSVTLTLPVIPVTLPHPESFGLLHDYLYTKRHDRLVASLLPLPYSALPPIDMSVPVTKRNLSAALAKTFTLHALVERARAIHGFWSNLCTLGVADEPLWKSLEIAWGILIEGMGMASAQLQPQPQPPKSHHQHQVS